MTEKNTRITVEADPETTTAEGEVYPDGLLPEWKAPEERERGRRCRMLEDREKEAASRADQLYGKRVNIGLLVPIESLRELKAFHGVDALELFIAEATRDFEQRLRVAIADSGDLKFRESIDVHQEQTGFDLMRRVYGIANAGAPEGTVEADLETDGKSSWKGVPGYHWMFASGGIDTELVRAEAEGGIGAVMKLIADVIDEQTWKALRWAEKSTKGCE